MGNQVSDTKKTFKPSMGTCYRPDLVKKNQCDKCDFRKYVLCENSENYKKVKKEYDKTK